jgi:hypothetical protein
LIFKVSNLVFEHDITIDMILFKASAWLNEEDATPFPWQYPATSMENLRYKTFKDLWKKGHYLTGGQKFGADFLVYPGRHHNTLFLCRLFSHYLSCEIFDSYSAHKS